MNVLKEYLLKLKKLWKEPKVRRLAIVLGLLFLYLSGLIAQFLNNRYHWTPGKELYLPSVNPLKGLAMLFTPFGAQALVGLGAFTAIGILLFFLFKEDRTGMKYDKKRNFWYSEKGVYGTAGWMDNKALQSNFDLTPVAEAGTVKEIIYGEKDGMVISRKPDCMLSPHLAVLGSTGTRKSRTLARGLIISSALKGESICCCDPKGELASDTKIYLEEKGYKVKILNLVDPKASSRFDGLEGALENPTFVANIVEAIIVNTGGPKGDHFFDAAEANLLSALIFMQMENGSGEYPTIKGAYWTLLESRSIDELSDAFDELPSGSRGLLAYNLFRKASANVQGNVIIGLGSRLSVLQNEEIAELMSYPDMDMLSLGREKTAYFLVLSDQDNTMRFVSATFFSLLFIRLVQYADSLPGRRLPVPVNLILDELCSVVGTIHSFHIKLSNVRSRAINISYFIQGIGQLQNRYPDNMWSEILSAADVMVCLGCNDPISADYVSDRSGEVTIYADTVMKQRNVFLPSILQPNYRHSEGAGRRMLLTMDEVLRMEPDKMLIMVRGQQMLEADKFDFTRNPESRLFRPVQVNGLKEVPQYPTQPITSPPPGDTAPSKTAPMLPPAAVDGSKSMGAAPNHDSGSTHVPEPTSTAEKDGKEVVPHVTDQPAGQAGGEYAGPTLTQIETPQI